MVNYYREFSHFKRYTGQVDSVADTVGKLPLMRGQSFIFLDVGSNDGELTERVMRLIPAQQVKVYAIEPDADSFERLAKRFSGNPDVHPAYQKFQDWLSVFGPLNKNKVDLILNSHTFYHFPRGEWKNIIS